MKKILILGAGMSASTMIKYLLDHSVQYDWKITVADVSQETALRKVNNHPNGRAIAFNINDEEQKNSEIQQSDTVISLLPAFMHPIVAKSCLEFGKNMVTASYVSEEMKALDVDVRKKNLIFLNEIGVDPGIDHMSAMNVIDRLRGEDAKITSFKSFTGGLVAPQYDNNPWNYKFTWNPRNVVVAGQGTAKYIEEGKYKYIPYHQLFRRTENFKVLNYGEFDGYANRDSLKYRGIYGLENIPTLLRGTLRRKGYCNAWNIFVQLGLTDDTYIIENSDKLTYGDFIEMFLPASNLSVEENLCQYLKLDSNSDEMYRLRWLGIFENQKIGLNNATPAQILQKLLEERWKLGEQDKDMIVMQHIFEYEKENRKHKLTSSMVVQGQDSLHTAMSITVGVPVAIGTKFILNGVIKEKGVVIPIWKTIYDPVMKELENFGIQFIEEEI